jgi:hypothetical protein
LHRLPTKKELCKMKVILFLLADREKSQIIWGKGKWLLTADLPEKTAGFGTGPARSL